MTGHRLTRQQAVVDAALAQCPDFVSAQQLHARLREAGSTVGLATVYRALALLATTGQADALRTDDGETVYRRCASAGHHHHLVCRSCGKAIEVQGPAVETWAERVSAEHGFRDARHTVEIFGTCASC